MYTVDIDFGPNGTLYYYEVLLDVEPMFVDISRKSMWTTFRNDHLLAIF